MKPKVPVIVVGNISAGGSGKTPLVIALCRLLKDSGSKPGIISKGYGRKSSKTVGVSPGSSTLQCGDEPVLLAQRTGVPVVVANDRHEAVSTLLDAGVEVILSDDGLQQSDFARSMEICVVDGARGLGNQHLIPAGPLREPEQRLERVTYVVSNGKWAGSPSWLDVVQMELCAEEFCELDGDAVYSIDEFRQKHTGLQLHIVAGIGNPTRFFDMLGKMGFEQPQYELVTHRFADHHAYRKHDFDVMKGASAIVMTEKDAVKCRGLGLENAFFVPVDAQLPASFEEGFRQDLARLTGAAI